MSEPGTLRLEVATPLGLALRVDAESVEAPSVNGEFGVLPGHRPLLAALRAGLLKYRADGTNHVAAVGAGFVEAGPDKVLLLTDQLALPRDIETGAVQEALSEAEDKLRVFPELHEGPEYEELRRAADWALARLQALAYAER